MPFVESLLFHHHKTINPKIENKMKLEGQFQIAEPCHENWENMTPEVKGRFCDACQKCVVDFSKMSKLQIKEVYDQEQGDVCGRMPISQLQEKGRPSIRGKIGHIRKRLRGIQTFALALLLVFGLQGMVKLEAQNHHPVKMGKIAYVAPTATLSGSITWNSGGKAAGQEVRISNGKETIQTITSNSSGEFVFKNLDPGSYIITVAPRYGEVLSQKVTLSARERKVITMELADLMVLGDTIYIPDAPEIIEEEIQSPEPATPENNTQGEQGSNPTDLGVTERPIGEPDLAIAPLVIPDMDPIDECKCIDDHDWVVPALVDLTLLAPLEPAAGDAQQLGNKGPAVSEEFSVIVFPNPVKDKLSFTVKKDANKPLDVKVLTIDGTVVHEAHWKESRGMTYKIDMEGWAAGTYLLDIQSGQNHHRQKVLKF